MGTDGGKEREVSQPALRVRFPPRMFTSGFTLRDLRRLTVKLGAPMQYVVWTGGRRE